MKTYEAIADGFVSEGTSAVFSLMGDANMLWMNAMAARGVSMVNVRHEGAGLGMADGWARATGSPGVCTTTSGPGTSQLATTMLVASRARTPLVAFCGDVAEGNESESQYLDQRRFAAAIEADFVRISSAAGARDAVSEAFYRARTFSRPVLLSAPADVQEHELPAGAAEYRLSTALTDTTPLQPHPDAIAVAAELIGRSARPVIIVGRGAVFSGAGDAIRRLALSAGALIATTLPAKGFLIEDEFSLGVAGGYSHPAARALFAEADCVVAVGASLSRHTADHGVLFPRAKVVHIDTQPRRLLDGGRDVDCFVRGDARVTADLIADLLDGAAAPPTGYRTPEARAVLETTPLDPEEFELEPATVDPRAACELLDELVPESIALVLGSGHQVRFPAMHMRRPRPFVIPQHHFGCIGQGLIVAMGACVAARAPVFVIEGDAGFMMHLAEFETAVRYDLPVLVVVMNDQAVGAEYHKSRALGLDVGLTEIGTPDLGAVGRALGGRGALATSLDELRDAVGEFVRRPGPYLLDVRISRTVLSAPYRRALYGAGA